MNVAVLSNRSTTFLTHIFVLDGGVRLEEQGAETKPDLALPRRGNLVVVKLGFQPGQSENVGDPRA